MSKLIDTIYESALDTGRWLGLLEQATAYFGARGAQIGNSDLGRARSSSPRSAGTPLPAPGAARL